MHISRMTESKYLKQDDVGEGKLVTVKSLKRQNIARDDEEPEFKYLMSFEEIDKPLVLNTTNVQLCARACGSDETDEWVGKKIVLYTDPNVSYGGKLVGGIRVRAPKGQATGPRPASRPATREDVDAQMANEFVEDSDVPF